MKTPLKTLAVIVAISGLAMAALTLYLFRSETVDNPELGRLTYEWSWGRQAMMTVDVNRDGRADARALYAGWGENFATHAPWDELWESTHCDGVFDRRSRRREALLLDVDTDRDGRFDLHLAGAEAESYLRQHPGDGRCLDAVAGLRSAG